METRLVGTEEASFEMAAAIKNAIYSDEPVTAKQLRYEQENWKEGFLFERLIAEIDGKAVATVCYFDNFWQHQVGKYDLEVLVHPDFQGRGIGSALYEQALKNLSAREPKATSLVASTREDQPRGLRFLQSRGFEPIMRWAKSRLSLTTFDFDKFEEALHKIRQQGIAIYSLADLQTMQPDWQRRYYELNESAGQDTPSPDPMSAVPFEQFVMQTFGHPHFDPEMHFIAVDQEGNWLGLTELGERENSTDFSTPFTCVHPSHRRRGIAMAVKLHAIGFAKQYGAQTITAVNEEHNPMYQINLALGFAPLPAGLTMKKILG